SVHARSNTLSLWSYCSSLHRDLHSFPTRRSSDLTSCRAPVINSLKRICTGNWNPVVNPGITVNALLIFSDSSGKVSAEVHSFFGDRKSTRLNSSHVKISYAVFCLKKKKYIT